MKITLSIPPTELRTRDIGRIGGIGDGLYGVVLTTTLTDGTNVVSQSKVFQKVRRGEVLNPKTTLTLATIDASKELVVSITAAISGQAYVDILKKVSTGLGDAEKVAELVLPVAATPLKVAKAVVDFSASFFKKDLAKTTVLEARSFPTLENIDGMYYPLESGKGGPPSEYFFIKYALRT